MKPGKMHGFLCQSNASTAVCIPADPRSVVLPRRPDRTLNLDPQTRSIDLKYSRLLEPTKFSGDRNAAGDGRVRELPTAHRTRRRQSNAATLAPTVPTPTTHGDVFQIVVMRVSIHCQGCAGKVKKHISRMEGVTSFSIDLESKRVTVMGHISPAGVLESLSKVKRAEFWQST